MFLVVLPFCIETAHHWIYTIRIVYHIQYILEPKFLFFPDIMYFCINFPLIKSLDFTIHQSSEKDMLYIEYNNIFFKSHLKLLENMTEWNSLVLYLCTLTEIKCSGMVALCNNLSSFSFLLWFACGSVLPCRLCLPNMPLILFAEISLCYNMLDH